MDRLKDMRKALRRVGEKVQAAEQRGLQRGRQEQLTDDVRAQIREEIKAELAGESAVKRSALRLGIPDALLGNFDGLGPDIKDWQKRADELHSAGISWDGDPLVREAAAVRLQAAEQAAEQVRESGAPINMDPAAMADIPPQVRERLITDALGKMQAAQAGGQPPFPESMLDEAKRMARNPADFTDEQRLDLAERFNRDLDGLHQQMSGGPL
jgi:hypothetical protein